MASQLLSQARRIAFVGTTGLAGLATYKAQTDPVHLFWDLDHTILCSICPLPKDRQETSGNLTSPLSTLTLKHFDQIDDDFEYNHKTLEPNTRTYFRPGARLALQLCSYFSVMHIYTAAQESYTNNIMKELDPDRKLFDKVLHRDEYPEIVKMGKDLTIALNPDEMHRAILFDDKVSNFKPQDYQNGIGVIPFDAKSVEQCLSSNDNEKWEAYTKELKEMARVVSISFWCSVHFSGDVRKVVNWVKGWNGDK